MPTRRDFFATSALGLESFSDPVRFVYDEG